jgi:hypothetical protein
MEEGMDVLAVMAGDGQMDPSILNRILDPVVEGRADYAKGDRISRKEHRSEMPTLRAVGNALLTALTRIASGYHRVSDPQDGYTAISVGILSRLDLGRVERGFAFENDMLVRLNVVGARVVDVPHPAIYRGQRSKIRYLRFTVDTSRVLLRDYIWRLGVKYLKGPTGSNRESGAPIVEVTDGDDDSSRMAP